MSNNPDPRLDEIQARLSAATPGPWKIDKDDPTNLVSIVSTADDRPWGWVEVARSLNPDAEFIANSRADVAYLRDELLKARRAAQTLGQVIDKQCLDVLEVTGLHHLINEDGDGHWDVVWMRLHEMAAELRKAREALARVESLADELDTNGAADMARSRTMHNEDEAREVLMDGAANVVNARHIRNAIKGEQ